MFVYRKKHEDSYPIRKSGHAKFITKVATLLITGGAKAEPVHTPKSPLLSPPGQLMSREHFPVLNVPGKAKRKIRTDEADGEDYEGNEENPSKKRKVVDATKPSRTHARLICKYKGCGSKTVFSCSLCRVALCIRSGARTCFSLYHQELFRREEGKRRKPSVSPEDTTTESSEAVDSQASEAEEARPQVQRRTRFAKSKGGS